MAKWETERSTCSFHGKPYEECGDAEQDWHPQLSVCYPAMKEKAAQRWFEEIHKDKPFHDDGTFENWSKDWSPKFPFHHSDGTTVWISKEELGLGGDFLHQEQSVTVLDVMNRYQDQSDR